jgi:hypothetical protein
VKTSQLECLVRITSKSEPVRINEEDSQRDARVKINSTREAVRITRRIN